ncbi:ParB/RepB/Spo0J family partition protein [Streptomyces sp. G45]|uniref:ParB/RepB/Spo0J family partition protein n=1 Tax=Streptomyces sp. G45 TaxID=3406627 RepID=UPI003C24B804
MSGRVADQLGTGASFTRTRGGVSARRQAVAATTGAPTTGAPDSRLRTLPLAQLVPTRFNPRRNFGTEDDLREFGRRLDKKQLQPAVAVTRAAYLALWPDEADAVGDAKYVIASGERRYRASRAAGLPTLEVVVDDEVARSRGDFLDAVLSENNDREDLDPIERALGIKTMADELGGKAKVAEYYGKSPGWVTQQMYLLNLVPELQVLVSSGELPVRETRSLVKLPADEQWAAWQARQVEREEEKSQPRPPRTRQTPAAQDPTPSADAPRPEPQPDPLAPPQPHAHTEPGSFTAVKPEPSSHDGNASDAQDAVHGATRHPVQEPAQDPVGGSDGFTAVKPSGETHSEAAAQRSGAALPDQRPGPSVVSPERKPPVKMPWADGVASMDIIFAKLSPPSGRRRSPATSSCSARRRNSSRTWWRGQTASSAGRSRSFSSAPPDTRPLQLTAPPPRPWGHPRTGALRAFCCPATPDHSDSA